MPYRFLSVIALICFSCSLSAQTEAHSHYQLYGGYSFISNSLNGVPGSHQGLSGYEASIAAPAWHNLRFKAELAGYRGTNLGAPQHPYYIMGGGQYTVHILKESVFVDALMGDSGASKTWPANGALGQTASFAGYVGGGLDTPITHRISFRVGGGYQYTYFALQTPVTHIPYRIPGLPTNFGRLTSGLVWKF